MTNYAAEPGVSTQIDSAGEQSGLTRLAGVTHRLLYRRVLAAMVLGYRGSRHHPISSVRRDVRERPEWHDCARLACSR
jgi:hypothetical protein